MKLLLNTLCSEREGNRSCGLRTSFAVAVCFFILGSSAPAQQDEPGRARTDLSEVIGLGRYYVTPITERKDPHSGFVVGGKNKTALIRSLERLNGRSLADLEADMRPGAQSKVGSEAGFLGRDESLLEVMAADNDYVVEERGLSHQELAKHLHAMGTIGFWQCINKRDGEEFVYRGRRFKLDAHISRGYQMSPFLDGTKTDTYLNVVNVDSGKKMGYSLLVPYMIERYGFYEGKGTPYRVDPKVILEVFDFVQGDDKPTPPAPRSGEISAAGERLAAALDKMDVEHLWLSKRYVHWESGVPLDKAVTDGKPHTHCSAFAAAACKRLGIYLLRPPEHGSTNLANAQADWLATQGAKQGWKEVKSPEEAQRMANAGFLVVASLKETEPNRSGHIAIVRPKAFDRKAIEQVGPAIIQAGMNNHRSTTLEAGFKSHPGAWRERRIRFFAHEIDAR